MGLSNETAPNTQPTEQYLFDLARQKADLLASKLIRYEHNPSPYELPNPAHGVRIRKWRPTVSHPYRVEVSEECAAHNDIVANLGRPK